MGVLLVNFRSNPRPENLGELKRAVAGLPQVLGCYAVTAMSDAIPKIAVRDPTERRDLLQTLALVQDVIERVRTCIVLEEFKDGPTCRWAPRANPGLARRGLTGRCAPPPGEDARREFLPPLGRRASSSEERVRQNGRALPAELEVAHTLFLASGRAFSLPIQVQVLS
ncbi:Lrp/AsnC ligand binding domain-containing protein [Deinococcus apachensis]|uniref:Lrp/AsnC ligand binding domain-containing protein n=1 Tax=Deinococcus apachensis TaxID=309886 RepID=UPI00037824E8|nr:Lrp/AsnC ligand binding domain-containing protein [Deinococcus apachensis]